MKRFLLLAVIVLLTLNACASVNPTPAVSPLNAPAAQSESPVATPPLPSPTRVTETEVPTVPPTAVEGVPIVKNLETRAIEDLAQRLGIPSTEIAVISAEKDEFPSANFGCPAVEKAETGGASPAFVVATEIVLEADGVRYHYRGKGNQLVFCFEES